MIFRDKKLNTLIGVVIGITLAQVVMMTIAIQPNPIIAVIIVLVFSIIIVSVLTAGMYLFHYLNGDRWSPRLVFLIGLTMTIVIWLLISLFSHFYFANRTFAGQLLFYSYKAYPIGVVVTATAYVWLKTNFRHLQILSQKEEEMRRIVQQYEAYLKEKQEAQQQDDILPVEQSPSKKLSLALQHLFENDKIYRRQGLSVSEVAKMLKTNHKYLSIAIQEHFQKGFVEYVNTFRAEEAIEMLKEQENGGKYANYSVEMIAEAVGFNSRITFYVAFKRIIGVTPKEYIEVLKQQENAVETEM